MTWFEVKIRYNKIMENGEHKKVTEPYLFDAMSFTESEGKCIKEMEPYISGEFEVSNIKRVKYNDVFRTDDEGADTYYKCKIVITTIEEDTGIEKATVSYVLVQASDFRDAVKRLDEQMKGTMADYVINSISATHIIDVYPYDIKK